MGTSVLAENVVTTSQNDDEFGIITRENGCNTEIEYDRAMAYEFSSLSSTERMGTAECMLRQFQELKRPLSLTVLLDLSASMQQSLSLSTTRWQAISRALPQISMYLEDSAEINFRCFNFDVSEEKCGALPHGVLSDEWTFTTTEDGEPTQTTRCCVRS